MMSFSSDMFSAGGLHFFWALHRIVKNWEPITKYFLEEIPKLATLRRKPSKPQRGMNCISVFVESCKTDSCQLGPSTALLNVQAAEITDGSIFEEPSS